MAFRPLSPADLENVLSIELRRVQARLLQASAGNRFGFRLTAAARKFLLADGLDLRYGAQHLRRSIERHLVAPLAHLMATRQVSPGDSLTVDLSEQAPQFLFLRDKASGHMSSWMGCRREFEALPSRKLNA